MARLYERLAALEQLSTRELRAEWGRVMREPPPPLSPDLLMRAIAHCLQERVHGGLPSSTRRHLKRVVKQVQENGEVALERDVVLKTGTRLSRDWRGKTHHVLVLEDGFLFQDRHYTSLTRIAFAITGANWSGPRFFGLKRRPKAFASAQHV
jgi:hypothetical protein